MADVSQLEINGTTYDICDATARDSFSQYLPLSGGTMTGNLGMDSELQYNSETAYPIFIRSSWSASSNESTLPITPCFVLDTTSFSLYWCDGQSS